MEMFEVVETKSGRLFRGDCESVMDKMIEDGTKVDLIVTSPPYDNLRTYNDSSSWNFEKFQSIADRIGKVLADGGVCVWVVGDASVNGSETGTSLRQALYFVDTVGLKLHDTMIYEKNSSTFPARRDGNRYTQIFEYMFVFSKGKPRVGHLICDKPNKWAGHTSWGDQVIYESDGSRKNLGKVRPVPDFSPRTNIWKYTVGFNGRKGHPAQFPDKLAEDHILTWTDAGDLVFDPFLGSGTTAIAAIRHGRKYIGSEIDPEYFSMCERYVKEEELLANKIAFETNAKR